MPMALPPLVPNADALVTSHRATCDGFLVQAAAKAERAQPFVDQARRLFAILEATDDLRRCAEIPEIQGDIATAAGFSAKSLTHLTPEESAATLEKWLEAVYLAHPNDWREEVFYRYLLIRGDSFGGIMRNAVGALAAKKLVDAISAALDERGLKCERVISDKDKIQEMRWENRWLFFDKSPKFIKKSVDVILLDDTARRRKRGRLNVANDYLACGELKGGIDPAGADEHWKTARSALDRIRAKFEGECPKLFFVGAAIERAMANEIFAMLQDGRLAYAANLTVPEQLADLAAWLVSL